MRSVLAIPHLIGALLLCAALESSATVGFTYAIEPFVKEVKSALLTEFEITYEWWVGFVPNDAFVLTRQGMDGRPSSHPSLAAFS